LNLTGKHRLQFIVVGDVNEDFLKNLEKTNMYNAVRFICKAYSRQLVHHSSLNYKPF